MIGINSYKVNIFRLEKYLGLKRHENGIVNPTIKIFLHFIVNAIPGDLAGAVMDILERFPCVEL